VLASAARDVARLWCGWENHPLTEVEFIPGGTRCRFNKIDDVIAANTKWLVTALS
jgi:hypothetical protein